MYHISCDGLPLLDLRDDDLVLVNPKVKLEVNTVGEGSFTIYKNHPHYDSLKKLKSVFEVTDDHGVIFRGRATGDTIDFDNGMMVDLEGAMAYFNDSIVRAFNFPDDFQEDEDYITAAESGNVIEFFLGWLIDNHNSQVQDFQQMKLGNVTVTDPNNYITRSMSEYASTWDVLRSKLFDSSLGGYLCIRYEDDGNYIDYLSEFTETNSQEIVFGENLIDLKRQTEASETYSAIIPIGALDLTVEGLEDGDITDDIVKSGDTLYSKSAVEEYGWIYAPTTETTWDDVTDDSNLLKKGAQWLANGGVFLNAMEATAVDLHFTDEQAESFRIYKNVNVRSEPHEVTETFPLAKLEIDLLNPQNTKIMVGKTMKALTDKTAMLQEEAKKQYSKLSKTDEQIKLEVQDELKGLSATITERVDAIELTVQGTDGNGGLVGQYSAIQQTLTNITLEVVDKDGMVSIQLKSGDENLGTSGSIDMTGVVTFAGLKDGTTKIDGGWIETESISADKIKVSELEIDAAQITTGQLTIGQLPDDVATTDDIPTKVSELTNDSGFQTSDDVKNLVSGYGYQTSGDVQDIVSGLGYQDYDGVVSIIDGKVTANFIYGLGVEATAVRGSVIAIKGLDNSNYGYLYAGTNSVGTTALELVGVNGLRLMSSANVFLSAGGAATITMQSDGTVTVGGNWDFTGAKVTGLS